MKKQYIQPSLRYAELDQKDGLMNNWSDQRIDPSAADPTEPTSKLPSTDDPGDGTDINGVKAAWGDEW